MNFGILKDFLSKKYKPDNKNIFFTAKTITKSMKNKLTKIKI